MRERGKGWTVYYQSEWLFAFHGTVLFCILPFEFRSGEARDGAYAAKVKTGFSYAHMSGKLASHPTKVGDGLWGEGGMRVGFGLGDEGGYGRGRRGRCKGLRSMLMEENSHNRVILGPSILYDRSRLRLSWKCPQYHRKS